MNTKHFFRFSLTLALCGLLSTNIFAQRYGRGGGYHGGGSYRGGYYPIHTAYGHPYYGGGYRSVFNAPYLHYGPAFGFRLNVLPFGFLPFYLGSSLYYYNQGIFYSQYYNGGYVVVAPPLGATINRLPVNAKVTMVDGQKYYQLGGTFYQEVIGIDNRVHYTVVGTNGVLNTNELSNMAAPSIQQQYQTQPQYQQVTPQYQQPQYQQQNQQTQPQQYQQPQNNNSLVGSRLLQLPDNCKLITVDNKRLYQSPAGTIYKEVTVDGTTQYEVTGSSVGGQ